MHLPWTQLEKDARERCAVMANRLRIPKSHAVGIADELFAWALLLAPDGDFSGRLEGHDVESIAAACDWPTDDAARLAVELQRAGFIATSPELRVRGLDRYRSAWEKNRTGGKGAKTHTPPRGTRGEPEADPKLQTQTQTQTQKEDLRTSREPPALVITAPDTPPDGWTADDFWRWAQSRRQSAGFVAEKHPGRPLSGWYSQVLGVLGGDVERLKEAFLTFGDDPYWQAPKHPPPLPFRAFMSQTDRYVPRRPNAS